VPATREAFQPTITDLGALKCEPDHIRLLGCRIGETAGPYIEVGPEALKACSLRSRFQPADGADVDRVAPGNRGQGLAGGTAPDGFGVLQDDVALELGLPTGRSLRRKKPGSNEALLRLSAERVIPPGYTSGNDEKTAHRCAISPLADVDREPIAAFR
jgi:hypothetical protein